MSNAWVICLEVGNSPSKEGIIFDGSNSRKELFDKVQALQEEPASYQLVGEVKAHQG